jgi:hypothetical protein
LIREKGVKIREQTEEIGKQYAPLPPCHPWGPSAIAQDTKNVVKFTFREEEKLTSHTSGWNHMGPGCKQRLIPYFD